MAGDDEEVLTSAIGYLRDTPPPWLPGNSALAAHRDRLFRPLERIRVGDDIWLATPYGDFEYRVRRTLVVEPTDLWVLDPLPAVGLTLITCFPFGYIGHAPHRFIVQAEKLWLPPR
jgi:sortase A